MNLTERSRDHADSDHPSLEQLNAFAIGQLPEGDSREVEQHLAVCTACSRILESSPDDSFVALLQQGDSLVLDGASPAVAPSQALSAVPGYMLLERLGQGGMGVVWKARQVGLNRLVALKRLRATGTDSAEALARFRREAESVARLRHANIVQIHEIGEQGGEPYLVLEYIGGGSLAQKLSAGPLSPLQAAVLVETLARAMHHAHENSVIHRDLKPGNVLLDEAGSPKISDFGLAKHFDEASPHTQTGAILGTPSYMAPEQASSERAAISPLTDVYALGAILYEVLTGRPPFRGPSVFDTLAQVREREPVPPRQFQPSVPGDLQTICLKCLHKEPRRRYGSALELADDLRRFLAGEPIRARPVGRRERLLKWMRRKPSQALLAAVVILIPLAGVAVLLWHNDRLQKETGRAQTAEQNAQENYAQSRQTLLSILDRFDKWFGSNGKDTDRVHEGIVQDSLAYIETALDKNDKTDPRVREDAARLLVKIGQIQWYHGRREDARANFDKAFSLWEQLSREHPEASSYRAELAGCYRSLAFMGDERQQLEWREKAVRMIEELYRLEPDNKTDPTILGQCHNDLACAYLNRKRFAEAEEHYQLAIRSYARRLEDQPDDLGGQQGLADSYANLGLLYHRTRRLELTESEFRRADALLETLVIRHPYTLVARSGVALNWGNLHLEMGQIDKALASYDRGIAWCDDFLRQEPNNTPAREKALMLHGSKANTFDGLQRCAEAAVEWQRVIEFAEGPARQEYRMRRCVSLARGGDAAHAAAEADALAAEPDCTPDLLYNLACVFALSGRAETAVAVLNQLRGNGYFDKADNFKTLLADTDFDSLRRRADFTKLIQGLPK